MIIYRTHYLGFGSWGDVDKFTLNKKADVIMELSFAADMDNGKDDCDTHCEYHPTKRAAEEYMREYTAKAKEYHAPIEEQ